MFYEYLGFKYLHCAWPRYSYRLNSGNHELKEENEEKHHEVEGRVGTEGLVRRPEPAEVRERREHDREEDTHANHGEVPQDKPANHIHEHH